MNSAHVATSGITAMLAIVLMYLTKQWPPGPMDLDTAAAVAGLAVAVAGGLVKLYQMYRPPRAAAQVQAIRN